MLFLLSRCMFKLFSRILPFPNRQRKSKINVIWVRKISFQLFITVYGGTFLVLQCLGHWKTLKHRNILPTENSFFIPSGGISSLQFVFSTFRLPCFCLFSNGVFYVSSEQTWLPLKRNCLGKKIMASNTSDG